MSEDRPSDDWQQKESSAPDGNWKNKKENTLYDIFAINLWCLPIYFIFLVDLALSKTKTERNIFEGQESIQWLTVDRMIEHCHRIVNKKQQTPPHLKIIHSKSLTYFLQFIHWKPH